MMNNDFGFILTEAFSAYIYVVLFGLFFGFLIGLMRYMIFGSNEPHEGYYGKGGEKI